MAGIIEAGTYRLVSQDGLTQKDALVDNNGLLLFDNQKILNSSNGKILLVDYTETQTVSNIIISDLNINEYKGFTIEIEIINATANPATSFLYFNNDTTKANYYHQKIISTSSTTTTLANTYPKLGDMVASSFQLSIVEVRLVGDKAVFFSESFTGSSQANTKVERSNIVKSTSSSNITEIKLDFETSVIAAGSKIRIYG